MTPPVELVFKRVEVSDEMANEPVVVAFVVVLTFTVNPFIVEDAACTMMPMVEVGTSDPPETFQSLKFDER